MPKYRIVFDDIEAVARTSDNPAIRQLTFGITFEAESQEAAKKLADEVPGIGRWHIEPVEETP